LQSPCVNVLSMQQKWNDWNLLASKWKWKPILIQLAAPFQSFVTSYLSICGFCLPYNSYSYLCQKSVNQEYRVVRLIRKKSMLIIFQEMWPNSMTNLRRRLHFASLPYCPVGKSECGKTSPHHVYEFVSRYLHFSYEYATVRKFLLGCAFIYIKNNFQYFRLELRPRQMEVDTKICRL
jgi:hypothetical protein